MKGHYRPKKPHILPEAGRGMIRGLYIFELLLFTSVCLAGCLAACVFTHSLQLSVWVTDSACISVQGILLDFLLDWRKHN